MLRLTRAALLGMTALASAAAPAQTGPDRTGTGRGSANDANGAANAGLSAAAVGDAGEGSATGDIVVTARKVTERLQDAPLTITAFSAQDIKSARIENLADVAKLTPGLNFTPLFGRQNELPIIRGVAQTLGPLNVGVFLDGIFLSGKAGVDLQLNELERIEVVEGPQSALYGRNTFAGAINYITKRPDSTLGGSVEGTLGTHGLHRVQGAISGPITDKIRFRVGGYYRDFDGWYRSAIDGGRVDFEKSWGGIATLELTPTERLTITLRGSYSSNDDGQPPSNVIRNNFAPGIPAGSVVAPIPRVLPGGYTPTPRNLLYVGRLPGVPRNGVLVNTVELPGQQGDFGDRERSRRASGTIEYDLDGVTLTSITAYAKRHAEYTYDGDNTICDRAGGCPNFGFPLAPAIAFGRSTFGLSSSDGTYRDISQELRVASSGKQRIEWLAGFFYYDNRTNTQDRGLSPLTGAGGVVTGFNTNYSYPRTISTTKAYSGFGSLTFHATEQLSLIGELRYEHERQTQRQFADYPTPATPTVPAFTAVTLYTTPLAQKIHFWTPRVIAKYQISPDAQVYASYARGEKEGGFNSGLNITPDQRAFSPEKTDNYELGVKSDLLDRKLRLNADVYYMNWKNQQAACQNPVSAGGSSTNRTYTCNVAASRIWGLEATAVVRPSSAFQVTASYAYTHARYREFVDASLAQVLALAGLPAIDFRGTHLPYVPDHKFIVSPQLHFDMGAVGVDARADLTYQSRTYLRADNLANFGDKTNVDLRLTGRYENFSLQLFANNVFDSSRPVAGVRFFDSTNYSVSSPLVQGPPRRELGVTAGYRF